MDQMLFSVDQVTPDANGEFSTEFNVSNWKQDGMYKIKTNQGTSLLYSITLSVEVVTSGHDCQKHLQEILVWYQVKLVDELDMKYV